MTTRQSDQQTHTSPWDTIRVSKVEPLDTLKEEFMKVYSNEPEMLVNAGLGV